MNAKNGSDKHLRTTQRGLRALVERMARRNARAEALFAKAETSAAVAALIYEARTTAGLTQAALAELLGTKQPVVARLEDAKYRGHSLGMLQRIANVLGLRLTITLTPAAKGS